MSKKKSLSEVQRAQIVALHGQNLSERQISAKMGCSKTAVHQVIAKYQQDGSYTNKDWKTVCHHCMRRQCDEEDSCEVTHEFNEEN